MENDFRGRQKKNYKVMRKTNELTRVILILGIGFVLLFAEKLNITQLLDKDNDFFRYFFGGLCIIYGSFRLYRVFKRNPYGEEY